MHGSCNGRVNNLKMRGPWFKPQWGHCAVFMSKTLIPAAQYCMFNPGTYPDMTKNVDWDIKQQLKKLFFRFSGISYSLPFASLF